MKTKNFMSYEKQIDKIMQRWYNYENEKVEAWKDKPWSMLDYQHMDGTYHTPRELIAAGKAEEVYKMIVTCIGG